MKKVKVTGKVDEFLNFFLATMPHSLWELGSSFQLLYYFYKQKELNKFTSKKKKNKNPVRYQVYFSLFFYYVFFIVNGFFNSQAGLGAPWTLSLL